MLPKIFRSKKPAKPLLQSGEPVSQDILQEIGSELLSAAHDPVGKILLYAEVEDGVISADIFSQKDAGPVRFRFAPQALKGLIYRFWQAADPSKGQWATMSYVIEDERFNLSFEYPDVLKPNEDLADRRPRVVLAHFGDARVDYSVPN